MRPRSPSRDFSPVREEVQPDHLDYRRDYEPPTAEDALARLRAVELRVREQGRRLGSLESGEKRVKDELSDTGRFIIQTSVSAAKMWRERAVYIVIAIILLVVKHYYDKGGHP
jgi:hypothetical protein